MLHTKNSVINHLHADENLSPQNCAGASEQNSVAAYTLKKKKEKKVPSFFRCLSEWYSTGFLWSSSNVLWTLQFPNYTRVRRQTELSFLAELLFKPCSDYRSANILTNFEIGLHHPQKDKTSQMFSSAISNINTLQEIKMAAQHTFKASFQLCSRTSLSLVLLGLC